MRVRASKPLPQPTQYFVQVEKTDVFFFFHPTCYCVCTTAFLCIFNVYMLLHILCAFYVLLYYRYVMFYFIEFGYNE